MTGRAGIAPLVLLAVIAGALAGPDAARGQSGDSAAVVFCYDKARGIVQRKLVADCAGEVVTPERAGEIKNEAVERRRRLLAAPKKPIVEGRKLRSIGTGFFVTDDGKLVTNNHVVEGCPSISVATPDGRKAEAKVLDRLPQDDLALVQAPFKAPAVATFLKPADLAQEEPVTVIGYPDQGLAPIRPLITRGTLGESGKTAQGRPRFKIKADIRHGNSGGPVLDSRALVIGVVFAKVNTVGVFQTTGQKVRFVGVVIDNPAVFEFLSRNKVAFRTAATGVVIDDAKVGTTLRPLVARIGCWH